MTRFEPRISDVGNNRSTSCANSILHGTRLNFNHKQIFVLTSGYSFDLLNQCDHQICVDVEKSFYNDGLIANLVSNFDCIS